MNDSDLELVRLLCTRLCHDLAGPIGAVAAGVELIGDDPAAVDAETLGLIGASSSAASLKLKFVRAALGSAAGALDMESLLDGYLGATTGGDGKPKVTWPQTAAFERFAAAAGVTWRQAILNLCLAALEMQPGCKQLSVSAEGPSVRIDATGQSMRSMARRDELAAALTGKTAAKDLTAKTVQAFVSGRMILAAGGAVEVEAQDGAVAVVVRFDR
ncbi:MAG: hypothetical protein K1X51_10385 [Rhodospirillaceae bacterium]|nr:hypothetical protein [Rhodospirillaceae bacterium]